MRALLVANPNATTTTPAVVDVIASALAGELELEIEGTKRRDHAGYLAAGAEHEGFDAVFALGGDGTVNEVVQGIAGTAVRLGVIPGGSTNVWARTLGLPNDPIEATAALLTRLRAGSVRTVNLGSIAVAPVDEPDEVGPPRLFAFNAGFGFDAEVVRMVEERDYLKHAVRQAAFLSCGVVAYLRRYDRRSEIRVAVDGGESSVVLRTAVCCNSSPYTFLGRMPAQLCPDASLDAGLDLMGLTGLSLPKLVGLARRVLTDPDADRPARPAADLRYTRLWHDRAAFRLRSTAPLPVQVDGDYIGQTTAVALRSVPGALRVIA